MYNTDTKSILKKESRTFKKDILRYNEYYDKQDIFYKLYADSKNGKTFHKLYELIIDDRNILLAYRTIKRNHGSTTPGTNKHDITYWENKPTEEFLRYIKVRLSNYIPQKIRRVEIPKGNGKLRPLGIPCIEDRIIQQCIKQVLEPICEAKFHPHSYGFRPNRGTEHAIARLMRHINRGKLHYIVDIDIKGFFDNVNHAKLLKQMWSMGIQDKRVLSIVSKMLKAEVEGIGIPECGVPQGGILSPLLSNIVLNELDWWISNQWETFNTNHKYANHGIYKALKKTKLKEMFIVRYADDFKIACKTYESATKIFEATKLWLKERLGLEISPEKSTITNVKDRPSDFLGFKLRAIPKAKKLVVFSSLTDKAKDKIKSNLKSQIKYMQNNRDSKSVYIYNRLVVGEQNYYSIASNVYKDFADIEYDLSKCLNRCLKYIGCKTGIKSKEFEQRYEHYGGKIHYALGSALYPIRHIHTKMPTCYNQLMCNYTEIGRELLHTRLHGINHYMLEYLANNPIPNESVEYNDNVLSLYSAQHGKCAISKLPLSKSTMVIHRIVPKEKGGNDRYSNLILLHYKVYNLIYEEDTDDFDLKLYELGITNKALGKLNKLRINLDLDKL